MTWRWKIFVGVKSVNFFSLNPRQPMIFLHPLVGVIGHTSFTLSEVLHLTSFCARGLRPELYPPSSL